MHDVRQAVADCIGVLQMQNLMLGDKRLIDIFYAVFAAFGHLKDDVAAVGDFVRKHQGEGGCAVLEDMRGIDVVALEIPDDALAVEICADHADHRAARAELPNGRQRRGNFSAELPAGLENLRALILLRGQVVNMHEVIDSRASVCDYFSHKSISLNRLRHCRSRVALYDITDALRPEDGST